MPAAVRRLWPVVLAAGLMVLLLTGVVVGVNAGAADVSARTVFSTIASAVDLAEKPDILTYHIVVDMRLPRVIAAIATGCGLAVSGAVLQSLTGNPLADPYILGISGGALLGAVAVIAAGVSISGFLGFGAITVAAFFGGIAALVLVFLLSMTRTGSLAADRMILAGVAVGQLTGAVSAAVVYFADRDAARRVQSWTLGSFAGSRWQSIPLTVFVVVLLCAVVLARSRFLDAFAFGDDAAKSLGINVTALRWILYSVVSLSTAALVAQAGLIGFVGLVVPHIVRMMVGPTHAVLLPLTMLFGATMMLWTDIVCRAVLPDQELPLGLATAIIGVPVFIWVLHRERKG